MTRIVGKKDRSDIEPDTVEAWRRGRALDAMLSSARLPRQRGVQRAPHRVFNHIDDELALAQARRLREPA